MSRTSKLHRAERRAAVNAPAKLWFHGESDLDRVLMGYVEPPKAESKAAVGPHLVSTTELVARYDVQRCQRCGVESTAYLGIFRSNASGIFTAVAGDAIDRISQVSVGTANLIPACQTCALKVIE